MIVLNDDELWMKCQTGQQITANDLGIPSNLQNCYMYAETNYGTFYTDGINWYNTQGKVLSYREIKKYGLQY